MSPNVYRHLQGTVCVLRSVRGQVEALKILDSCPELWPGAFSILE